MKSRMVEVAGLNLKITIHNNMLALSYNIDGLSIYNSSRIIRNSKLQIINDYLHTDSYIIV